MLSTKEGFDLDALISEALGGADKRTRRIVSHRYGLESPKTRTLADLGDEYSLTRERVRQIEAAFLDSIRAKIKAHEEAAKFLKLVETYLTDVGGLRRSDFLARDFSILLDDKRGEDLLYNQLHFLAKVLERPLINRSNDEWHLVWYTEPKVLQKAEDLVRHLLSLDKHDFSRYLAVVVPKYKIPEPLVVNYLTLSKRFASGPYGDLGADHWVHVAPKTVRDKAYLVLKKSDNPLHFTEIARLVNSLDERKRAPATVHNELIRDPRFVLVGRGTYAIND
ncbi:MAG: hypothetical protein HYS89_02155 [Candidatus Colwellbacteria bacterium]|nr:hypothetical protein [Candidatus Colwellbacteria bacterium]